MIKVLTAREILNAMADTQILKSEYLLFHDNLILKLGRYKVLIGPCAK